MYRVRTNQVNVPLEGLRVFEPLISSASALLVQSRREMDDVLTTPRRKVVGIVDGEIVEESDDELPVDDDVLMNEEDSGTRLNDDEDNRVTDVTSSAVKGSAVHGLLELRKGFSG
jgi:hypothetical protein